MMAKGIAGIVKYLNVNTSATGRNLKEYLI